MMQLDAAEPFFTAQIFGEAGSFEKGSAIMESVGSKKLFAASADTKCLLRFHRGVEGLVAALDQHPYDFSTLDVGKQAT